MNRFTTLLFVSWLGCAGLAAQSLTPPSLPGPLAASASHEVSRLVRSMPSEPRRAQSIQQQPAKRGWVARHPKLTGALVGFGVGCAVGASRVGGSTDNFFNALDELACPVVGGIGAAAGAFVGALVK